MWERQRSASWSEVALRAVETRRKNDPSWGKIKRDKDAKKKSKEIKS